MPPMIFEDIVDTEGDRAVPSFRSKPVMEDLAASPRHVMATLAARVQSAPEKMKSNEYETSTKTPRTGMRPALDELVLSSSRLNIDMAAAITANRLIDFTRGTPPGTRHGLILRKTPDSALSHHKRRLSKATRNTFSRRSSASQDNVSVRSDSDSTVTEIHTDLGGPSRPIMYFRPNLWRHLERNRSTLNLDLFWPLKPDPAHDGNGDEEFDVFPLDDMRPLCDFRHLRSLQLNGMLRSYQKYIWQTCWLNPALEELTLEMALEPTMHDPYSQHCPAIEGDWKMMREGEGSMEYLGQDGEGTLNLEFGIGEYLDKQAIATAKLDAAPMGGRLRCLTVVKLALLGFVIDSGALKWFDPMRLRQIDIKHNCVDAGFALPTNMVDLVNVSWPGKVEGKIVTTTKVAREDLHVITRKKGKVVNEKPRLKRKVSSLLSYRWFPDNGKPMARDERRGNKAGTKLPSSNSMSSLGQNSSSGASRKSQDFLGS